LYTLEELFAIKRLKNKGMSTSASEDWLSGKLVVPSYIPSKFIPMIKNLVANDLSKWLVNLPNPGVFKPYVDQMYTYLSERRMSAHYLKLRTCISQLVGI
jgi:hypothetical protein